MTAADGSRTPGPGVVPVSPGNAWSTRHSWTLAGLALAGLLWRLHVALGAPWYWDEGYVAEWARGLAAAPWARPHVGGLWEDGFFPLSTSFLAPLSAAPFTLLPGCPAMTGVRLWAVGLDMAALGALVLLARPKENPRLALLAAACYALLPFAADFGGRAFYHHFAVVLMLACLALGRDLFDRGRAVRAVPASLCAGLAVASCYWLWWLPLSWVLLLAWKRPRAWGWGLFWTALPPLAVLAVNILPDPRGAWWSVQGMLKTGAAAGPQGLTAWISASQADLRGLPFLAVGLTGLAWSARRRGGPWAWFLFCLACAELEPVRQRGDIVGMPYPFILAAPLAALGAAALADAALGSRAWPARLGAAAALALFFMPVDLAWLRLWSFTPGSVAELKDFLDRDGKPGDLVCGLPHFNWDLRPDMRVCEPFDLAAAEGRATGFYVAGAPASRFAYVCRPADVRYVVVSRVHLLGLFRFEGLALSFLEMERAGWRPVFDDKTFKVFENPAFGVGPDAASDLLQAPDYYRLARDQALRAGRPDLAAFAQGRLDRAGTQGRAAGLRSIPAAVGRDPGT